MNLVELSTNNFELFSKLLSGKEFGGCFCAVWRSLDDTWGERCRDSSKPNLEITRSNLKAGNHIGYLVFENTELIGWTGSGPKTAFPILESKLGSRLTPFASDVWSIGCIAIKAEFRRRSKSNEIIQAVIREAKAGGAISVEAYPTDPWDEPRSYRGSLERYIKLGFKRHQYENDGQSKIVCMKLEI